MINKKYVRIDVDSLLFKQGTSIERAFLIFWHNI